MAQRPSALPRGEQPEVRGAAGICRGGAGAGRRSRASHGPADCRCWGEGAARPFPRSGTAEGAGATGAIGPRSSPARGSSRACDETPERWLGRSRQAQIEPCPNGPRPIHPSHDDKTAPPKSIGASEWAYRLCMCKMSRSICTCKVRQQGNAALSPAGETATRR